MSIRKFFNIQNSKHKALIKEELININALIKEKNSEHTALHKNFKEAYNDFCPNCASKKITIKDFVNYCNTCMYEWDAFRDNDKNETDFYEDLLNNLADYLNKKDTYSRTTFNLLQTYHAETIYKVRNSMPFDYYSLGKELLTLPFLRKHFTSVFDTNI